jgi:hypothetical protein
MSGIPHLKLTPLASPARKDNNFFSFMILSKTKSINYLIFIISFFHPVDAQAYSFNKYFHGRQNAELEGRYDLAGIAWKDPFSLAAPFTFDWNIVFPTTPSGVYEGPFIHETVRNVWSSTASSVISAWSQWANIAKGEQKATNAQIRFVFSSSATGVEIPTDPTSAADFSDPVSFAIINFQKDKPAYWSLYPYPNPLAQPVASQIRFSALHEFGHALGLADLYKPNKTEEFVDHPVKGNSVPDRDNESRFDNIMQGAQSPGAEGIGSSDYPHNPVIDNDEIAAVSWLWGGKYNQIVTGDLEDKFDPVFRSAEAHHGDQLNPAIKGWWDYRISIVPGGTEKPFVDIIFPGYQTYSYQSLSGATVSYGGNQGGYKERFVVDQEGWNGNIILYLKSSFTEERRVQAWLNGGNRSDDFTLPALTRGLTFDGTDSWAMPFGPLGDGNKDYGDAPDSYQTLLDSNGPRYNEGDLQRIGFNWDYEPDGQPTLNADGDDNNTWWGVGGQDDEDGVIFGDSWVDVIFNIARAGSSDYQLRAWWDTNSNGIFDHRSELYIDDLLSLSPGFSIKRYNLSFNPSDYYSRFRLTWDPLDLDVKPFGESYSKSDCNSANAATGNCISHGEVEDYAPVPGPLPMLGVGAFFSYARRLRRLSKSLKTDKIYA